VLNGWLRSKVEMDQVSAKLSKQDPDHPVMAGAFFAESNRDKVTRIQRGARSQKSPHRCGLFLSSACLTSRDSRRCRS
jgi:hypothetical protein